MLTINYQKSHVDEKKHVQDQGNMHCHTSFQNSLSLHFDLNWDEIVYE